MRRIVVSMWVTLDGYAAGPQDEMDWLAGDERMMEYETSLVTDAEALLLGRITHGDFASAWPRIARDDSETPETRTYAQRVDDMPKIVVSRSGEVTAWGNTHASRPSTQPPSRGSRTSATEISSSTAA